MYGIQAITAHNGWAMALAGALIVFSGLIVLSFAISHLHKLLKIFEKQKVSAVVGPPPPAGVEKEIQVHPPPVTLPRSRDDVHGDHPQGMAPDPAGVILAQQAFSEFESPRIREDNGKAGKGEAEQLPVDVQIGLMIELILLK